MQEKLAHFLAMLADCYQAVANDVHTLHLNYRGAEFDSMHADVLKRYYEQLNEDADDCYERSIGLGLDAVPSLNDAAQRIEFQSMSESVQRECAIDRVNVLLTDLCKNTHDMYNVFEEASSECPIVCGIANWLQDRLMFWGKELSYFNKRRGLA